MQKAIIRHMLSILSLILVASDLQPRQFIPKIFLDNIAFSHCPFYFPLHMAAQNLVCADSAMNIDLKNKISAPSSSTGLVYGIQFCTNGLVPFFQPTVMVTSRIN